MGNFFQSIQAFFSETIYTFSDHDISIGSLLFVLISIILSNRFRQYIIGLFDKYVLERLEKELDHKSHLRNYVNSFTYIFCLYTLLLLIDINNTFYSEVYVLFSPVLEFKFIEIGEFKLSFLLIIQCAIVWLFATEINLWIHRYLLDKLNTKYQDEGSRDSITKIINYVLFTLWVLIGFQLLSINISVLLAGSAVLGIGIGFGLQNMASNFVSGIVILFEKPIKKDDLIEVDGILGRVCEISFRSTIIRTRDNITIIVPNSKIISENVTNWSHGERMTRIHIPVGVSYNCDLNEARKILLNVANKHLSVLAEPDPKVLLEEFGDNSVNLTLWVWTLFPEQDKYIKSEIYFEIFELFREAGIEIPYPQRDVHIIKDDD